MPVDAFGDMFPGVHFTSGGTWIADELATCYFNRMGGRAITTHETGEPTLVMNFADAASNDNVTPSPWFPGEVGAELALWKGIVE